MKKRFLSLALAAVLLLVLAPVVPPAGAADLVTLRYGNKGLFDDGWGNTWVEDISGVTPAVADLDGDGKLEIITSSRFITVFDAASGEVKWRVNAGKDKSSPFQESGGNIGFTFADIEVTDIDKDGKLEIITSIKSKAQIIVLDNNGYFKSGWPKLMTDVGAPSYAQLNALTVADIDLDGYKEIIVGLGIGAGQYTTAYVFHTDGRVRAGWPQLTSQAVNNIRNETVYAGAGQKDVKGQPVMDPDGTYMDNIIAADITGDANLELIFPADNPYMIVYNANGTLTEANQTVYPGLFWAQIPWYVKNGKELNPGNKGHGWTPSASASNGIAFTEGYDDLWTKLSQAGTAVADLDGDGKLELLTTVIAEKRLFNGSSAQANMPTETLYVTLFIRNGDGTRWTNAAKGYDWTEVPQNLGEPLHQNYPNSFNIDVNLTPTVSDLNGDGEQEILFASYNGKLHCFSLDGTEHDNWPYVVSSKSSGSGNYEFASRPVAVDLDNNGTKEVVFTTWYDTYTVADSGKKGHIIVLDSKGNLLQKTELPGTGTVTHGTPDGHNNGAMAKPVLADVDKNGTYELVVVTTDGGLAVYNTNAKTVAVTPAPAPATPAPAPSGWAADSVKQAQALKLSTAELEKNFQAPTTRGEFARLAVNFIEVYYGASIDSVLAGKNLTRGTFTDTTDAKILAANALKIVAGVGDGTAFDPNGKLNREQAAVMLANTLKAVGVDSGAGSSAAFTDISEVSSWAADGVNTVKSRGIMSGTGDGTKFAPKDPYTHEQSISTILRLYDNVK
ncbi:MAG: FG-GAP-like repeat-containing protein [Oscillospiraceae bacterium]|jgi:hypothetical protein|nr:FG-GAP-like repeat-containing protein [Oscillospiraceae bacterium]